MNICRSKITDFQVHPLGFYFLALERGPTTSRIHVYAERNGHFDNNEWHTHEFDLQSKVLAGTLQNFIGEFSACVEQNIIEFSVEYDGEKSTLIPTGRSGCIKEVANFSTTLSLTYFIRAGTIHRATSIEFPCVTHVHMKHTNGKILSYGSEELPFSRRPVSSDEALEIHEILENNGLLSLNQ